MVYKATMEIGGYKKGDVVPDEKAIVWEKMYDVCPVEKVSGKSEPKEEPTELKPEDKDEAQPDEEPKEEEKPAKGKPKKGSSIMLDDYLARNGAVVVKNVKTDGLPREALEKLLELEKSNKNREEVIEAIESVLEGD